jgi:hypothetical protein
MECNGTDSGITISDSGVISIDTDTVQDLECNVTFESGLIYEESDAFGISVSELTILDRNLKKCVNYTLGEDENYTASNSELEGITSLGSVPKTIALQGGDVRHKHDILPSTYRGKHGN